MAIGSAFWACDSGSATVPTAPTTSTVVPVDYTLGRTMNAILGRGINLGNSWDSDGSDDSGWGNPIRFIRWAPAVPESNRQPTLTEGIRVKRYRQLRRYDLAGLELSDSNGAVYHKNGIDLNLIKNLETVLEKIDTVLTNRNIKHEIKVRTKNVYGIYKKIHEGYKMEREYKLVHQPKC